MAPQIATTFEDDSAARHEHFAAFRAASAASAGCRAYFLKVERAPSTMFETVGPADLVSLSSESLPRMALDGLAPFFDSQATCFLDSPVVIDVASCLGRLAEPRPSERLFELLAKNAPDRLLEYLGSGSLRPADLAFAAEAAGLVAEPTRVIPALLGLLQHAYAPVREAAIYALARHAGSFEEIRSALRVTAEGDPSPGVKEAAAEALAP